MTNTANKNILLIEDDQFLSSLLKNRFQKEGFEVTLARDGDEALKALETLRPAIILLDLILPGRSGFEVLERVRTDVQIEKTPVVIISNLGQEEDINRVRALGITEYFVKAKTPIDELIDRVKRLI